MKESVLTREELYELVWSKPLTRLAEQYDISDLGLRKICLRYKIPLPGSGYWTRIKFGYKHSRKKLPKFEGDDTITLKELEATESKISTARSKTKKLAKELESDYPTLIEVPKKISKPHLFVKELKENVVFSSEFNRYPGVSYGNNLLDVKVTKKNFSRALGIFDAVIKALLSRGHQVKITHGFTVCTIYTIEIEIGIREKYKRTNYTGEYSSTEYKPTGELAFQIGRWKEKEIRENNKPLENQISSIIAKLEVLAGNKRQDRDERRRRWEVDDANQRIKEQIKRHRISEEVMIKELLEQYDRWNLADRLRDFLTAFKKEKIEKDSFGVQERYYVNWGYKIADSIDPLSPFTMLSVQNILSNER